MWKMRKIAVLLTAALAAALLGGCGNSFDASSYVKALLDNSYKNDSTTFVEEKVGTEEQAEELYKLGIESVVNSITSQAQLSDELNEEFTEVVKDVYKNVKYTVGESVKEEDDSYEVEVTYQKMNVFAPAMESFNAASQAYQEELTEQAQNGEEIPSDDEMSEALYTMLKDAIKEALENVTYEDEASTTIHIELVDKVYTPNEDDVYNLEQLLIDTGSVSEAQ